MRRVVSFLVGLSLAVPTANGQNPERGLRLIVVATDAQAAELRERIEAGDSFTNLARQYSIDASARSGGYISVSPAELRQEFREALEGLEPGEVSAVTPVAGQFVLLEWAGPDEVLWTSQQELGVRALEAGNLSDAVLAFLTALQPAESPGFPPDQLYQTLRGLAEAYRLQGAWREAATTYERLLLLRWSESPEDDGSGLLPALDGLAEVLGWVHFRDNRFGAALEHYLQLTAATSPTRQLYLAMSQMLSRAQLHAAAEAVLLQATEAFPDSNRIRYEMARLYQESSQPEKARAAYEEVDRMARLPTASQTTDPNFRSIVQEQMGHVYKDLYRFDDAARRFENAVDLAPEREGPRLALGELYSEDGQQAAAVHEYELVIANNPSALEAWLGIATARLRMDQLEGSIAAAERAIAIAPSHLGVRYALGTALIRAGRSQEGREQLDTYRQMLSMTESRLDALREIDAVNREAAARWIEGKAEEAIGILRRGTTSHPEAGILFVNLGTLEASTGQQQAALGTLLHLIDLESQYRYLAHRSLAELYKTLGETRASEHHRALYLQSYDAALFDALP